MRSKDSLSELEEEVYDQEINASTTQQDTINESSSLDNHGQTTDKKKNDKSVLQHPDFINFRENFNVKEIKGQSGKLFDPELKANIHKIYARSK